MAKPTLAIVGAGKVGSALAVALQHQGYPIVGVASRSTASAQKLAERLRVTSYSSMAADITPAAQVVFITTPDREIVNTARDIGQRGGFQKGQIVIHTSGSLPSTVLNVVHQYEALAAAFHPLQSFADVDTAIANLPKSFFALEGDRQAQPILKQLLEDLEGRGIMISPQDKPLYHAAAVVTSNYLVTIIYLATTMLGKLGLEQGQAVEALLPLITGTIENIKNQGPVKALTGPVERGDSTTLKQHLEAMAGLNNIEQEVYKALGYLTVEIARHKGSIDADTAAILNTTLRGEIND